MSEKSHSFSPLLSFLRPQCVFYLHLLPRITCLYHGYQAFLLRLTAPQFATASALISGIAKNFLCSTALILHLLRIGQKDYSETRLQPLFLLGFQNGLNAINLAQSSNF